MLSRVRKAFTLIELLVVIAIIAILAAILFPVFAQAKASAKTTSALSNLKQLATANLLYMNDNDDNIGRKYWDVHVDFIPYVKSIDIFNDPASAAPRVRMAFYSVYNPSDDLQNRQTGLPASSVGVLTGNFPTNIPQDPALVLDPRTNIPFTGANTPAIFGHFARNDEYIYNYGDPGGSGNAANSSTWSNPSGVIFYSMAKDGTEDDDANDYDEDNAMYFEPFGTDWNQIFAQISLRHRRGAVFSMLDTSTKWRPASWLQSREGKLALNPRCVDVANNLGWNATRCNFTGN